MTRTARYRIFTILTLGSLVLGLCVLWFLFMDNLWVLIATLIAFAALSRIPVYLWGPFYAGQRLLRKGNHLEALQRFERFARELKNRPDLRRVFWLTFAPKIYTHDIEVINLINIGICYLMINRPERAKESFEAARLLDEESPMPYYHLALVQADRGDPAGMEQYLAQAEQLGFPRKKCDGLRAALATDHQAKEARTKAAPAKVDLAKDPQAKSKDKVAST